ncbi:MULTISPECIES: CPBP family intramembrane glutamic endopeptidase [unclassified Clostridium]|uniref:CPBP family intramembrane glutamic endopeptidase n=1 Tax=unclassified Clostridium TaxID=2614128 RepID=UPI0002974C3D|nr:MULTISPECIES: CPBP family intramembrane glutamic endopeptidase [unclassified Clostridium]EKQ50914.1 MAG: CAAX amino terminal protease family [Clostridium sp. Maddingley MBC34-26]
MKSDNDLDEVKIRHVIIIYLINCVVLIITAIAIIFNSGGEISGSNMNNLSLLSGILLLAMLSYKLKLSREKIGFLYKDFKNKINIKESIWIVAFFVCLNLGAIRLLTYIIYLISPTFASDFVNNFSLTINSVTDYLICFIISVILSPIVNEIIFRFVLFKRLSKKFNVYVGIIVSSIIFAAFDFSPEIIGALALGIINCILYIKYENILMPMLIYFMSNLFVMLLYIPTTGFKTDKVTLTLNSVSTDAILGTVLFTIGIISFIIFVIKGKVYLKSGFWENKCIDGTNKLYK